MLTVYVPGPAGLVPYAPVPDAPVPEEAAWVDLYDPLPGEVAKVEAALALELPTREEMQEIEASSRLYQEDSGLFMTAVVLSQSDTDHPENTAVTFILAGSRLITIRHAEPKPFKLFAQRSLRLSHMRRGDAVMVGLLEAVIDRAADILERVSFDVDALSREVFQHSSGPNQDDRGYQEILRDVGQQGDLASRARESLMSIGRLLAFLTSAMGKNTSKEARNQVKIMWRDVQSLLDHVNFLSSKITFLLDATLGMISIEQNATIKIFSVVAVIFLPPTLVASIYGMNFDIMPELSWPFGYPFALGLMVLSAIMPYLYFKRRGWL